MNTVNLRKAIGPGLLYAGAAIGVSHLVQSTRAGAEYGFALVGVVLLACASKYVFMEVGPRYAAATGESLIQAYRRLGMWAMALYLIATVGTMFTIQAAVTLVTAAFAGSLLQQFFGFSFTEQAGVNIFIWCLVVQVVIFVILLAGRYGFLDLLMKIIVTILSVSTVAAVLWSAVGGGEPVSSDFVPAEVWTMGALLFCISLIGWMPTPIDCSVWQSLWTLSRAEQTEHRPSWSEAKFDFNLGYLTASILALFFLAMGALVMYGRGDALPGQAVGFAMKLIAMYTETFGDWSTPLITVAAFTAMLSTTLTVTDAYPRLWRHFTEVITPEGKRKHDSWLVYFMYLFGMNAVAMFVIGLVVLGGRGAFFTFMVDLATALSVITAPILALLNYRVVTSAFMPESLRPGKAWRIAAGVSFGLLLVFVVLYAWVLVDMWTQPAAA